MKKFFSWLWKKTKGLCLWVWKQLKDPLNLGIFIVCFILLSSEVWLPYLLGIIFHNGWLIGVGSACWAFWLGPFTPFLPLCIALTLGVRKIIDKIRDRRKKKSMKMKPKTTTKNARALLYKRFIGLEKSMSTNTLYKTSSGEFWSFDNENLAFVKVNVADAPGQSTIIEIEDFKSVLQYQDKFFSFNGEAWVTTDGKGDEVKLLSATFGNIGKYQTNKYYFVGSFDFMIKGSIEGTQTQYIKGNIMPLTSLNIKHFNDNILLTEEDLVVIDGHLYSVENPEIDHKHQPKDYKVYFATLNSIL